MQNINFRRLNIGLVSLAFFLFTVKPVAAWSEHPLIAYPVLKSIPEITQAPEVEVKSLATFLLQEEQGLAELLANQEVYSRANIQGYAPRPDALAFTATGNGNDIVQRFLQTIRVNPNSRMALYLHLPPGSDGSGRQTIDALLLTTLSYPTDMLRATYLALNEGEMVAPLLVLSSATNEPDYGMDLGLFEDNNTWWGDLYGFGAQTFGNPNLEYGTQAPFHMGFYHEAGIVFAAAPFLRRTFVEYRIHLYQTLAEYAFSRNQHYWGYRFMGWAMHYIGDLSVPYHASVLPGVSALRMIWINLKAMLGFPRSRDNAVQLVSNRHAVYEHFQYLVMREAFETGNKSHPLLLALAEPVEKIAYTPDFPRTVVAKGAFRMGRETSRAMRRNFPRTLISDPTFEVVGSAEMENLIEYMTTEKGQDSVEDMTKVIAERFRSYSMHTHSFVEAMVPHFNRTD
ncbi:MAG TPA: hypothetical protein VLH61_10970 [Bacteroidales bacterium]|nr:hypothetical protein [Bacteroidales bacterium]